MTDQEINEAVARKLGWKISTFPVDNGRWWAMEGKSITDELPDYCHSIEAAWEVVEYLFSSFYLSYDECTETWFCRADCCRVVEESCKWRSEADTAPMAICLAFLKLP